MIRLFQKSFSLFLVLSVIGLKFSLGSRPEKDRYISLGDLYEEYHYTRVFSSGEQKEIEETLNVLRGSGAQQMLKHNLGCFGEDQDCKRILLSEILSKDPEIRIMAGNTMRNGKAVSKKNKKWFFHFAVSLPHGSYPFANLFRAPFARKLQDTVKEKNMFIKVSRQGIFPLYDRDTFFKVAPGLEDIAVYAFIVVADFERMDSQSNIEMFLKTHEKREELKRDLQELVNLTGFVDLSVNNIGLESKDGKIVLFDTEPLYGEVLLEEEEYSNLAKKPYEFTFDYYNMNREELSELSAVNPLIRVLNEKSASKKSKSSSEDSN